MEIIVGVLVLVGIWYWLSKLGSYDFWKVAAKHPNEAYDWFMVDGAWAVVDPDDPMSMRPEPREEYDGPNWLWIPKLGGRRISIWGRIDSFEASQKRFIARMSQS